MFLSIKIFNFKPTIIFIWLLDLLVVQTISDKPVGKFESIPDNLGLDDINLPGYEVAGMGDFNSDKFTDLVMISNDRKRIELLFYNQEDKKFQKGSEAWEINSELPVVNLVPGDWNFDGQLDLLIMKEVTSSELELSIYLGQATGFSTQPIKLPSSTEIQPIVFDYNGDMKPDLLGYRPGKNSNSPVLSLWKNVGTSTSARLVGFENPVLFEVSAINPNNLSIMFEPSSPTSLGPNAMCLWSSPHSNGFIDLNGDCLPDLFITCKDGTFQIWLNNFSVSEHSKAKFTFSFQSHLPENSGPITFADLRGEGSLDMVFSTCNTDGCILHTVENSQLPVCSSISQVGKSKCRDQENLCVADPEFQFQLDGPGHRKLALAELVKNTNYADKKYVLSNLPSTGLKKLSRPIPIRLGDFNLDGFPDILLSLSNRFSSDQSADLSLVVLQSIPCTSESCTGTIERKRTYQLLDEQSQPITLTSKSLTGHFFDFHEDGSLDLLVISWNTDKAIFEQTTFVNHFHNDAFFLKAMVSNGACPRLCKNGGLPYGANQYGATIKVVVSDSSGSFHAHQAVQLPQSSYYSFQAPYCHLGLGRINNYLQNLVVGSSRHNQEKYYRSWSGVIPNSQLVILPYQSQGRLDSEEWTRELFLNPGKAAMWVLLVLTLCMAVLASVVVGLAWAEKREDEADRRRAIHHINFGSL